MGVTPVVVGFGVLRIEADGLVVFSYRLYEAALVEMPVPINELLISLSQSTAGR